MMNILPKKSWHVRTRKNIERVRRDEAEAERLERKEQDRKLLAEQEARIRELRARAGIKEPDDGGCAVLFAPGVQQLATNKDHEEEKRLEEIKWEQKVGILNRLVRPEDVDMPWYCNERYKSGVTTNLRGPKKPEPEEKVKTPINSNLILSIYDPMTAMKDAEQIVRAKREEQKILETKRRLKLERLEDFKTFDRESTQHRPSRWSPIEPKPIMKPDKYESTPEVIRIVRKPDDDEASLSKKVKKGRKHDRCKKEKKHKKYHKHRHKHERRSHRKKSKRHHSR